MSTQENAETPKEEKDELTIAQEALATEKDKFLRLFAEFENYKKRTSKERIELFKTAGQDVLQSLLPVLDDFDRAQKVPSDDLKGKIIDVIEKGYKLGDKIIRFPKVVTGN